MTYGTFRIESLLSARLFLVPQVAGNQLYFVSNLSGRLSLYRMRMGGSVPQPLLPPHVALQNPHLMEKLYHVFPRLGVILVMLDNNGDENYQPMLIPIDGGYPTPAFSEELVNYRVQCVACFPEDNIVYLVAEARKEARVVAFQGNLATGELLQLGESPWGIWADAYSQDHRTAALIETYTIGDNVVTLWNHGQDDNRLLYGKPMALRTEGEEVPLNSIFDAKFVAGANELIFITSLFEDTYGLGHMAIHDTEIKPTRVPVVGLVHEGAGELERLKHLQGDRYALIYNIDGSSWVYEGRYEPDEKRMQITAVVCGQGELADGVLESHTYDRDGDQHVLSFSTATSPTQLYTVKGAAGGRCERHTDEQILSISPEQLSAGEDASYVSHDGTRISARLYLPAESLGYEAPFPLVYYVHGGPQSQERPDFAWFSMPLIQFLTLSGFAVFVPNVRGSSGYGLSYMKQVDRDWGGQDRLDHVHAMTEVLPLDSRLDTSRAAVIGRSYGGYMTLTLATRHPELWRAAVDMFGPYNILTFIDRLPETWKPYFAISVGDPVKDRDFLLERSPASYIEQVDCPLLVIQGQNDPRVIERESRDVVEQLRAADKTAEYLLFADEGHDVLKYENKVRCYNAIADFFRKHL